MNQSPLIFFENKKQSKQKYMILAYVKFVDKLKLILTIIECFVECFSKHRTETDALLDAITF